MKKQNISTTNEIWTIFGERLKTELERQGISLRQFADKAGLTLNTACRYAHSQRTPRATEIIKAAEVLHVTCDYMLGLSDDPHKTRDGWEKAGFHELPSAQPEPSQVARDIATIIENEKDMRVIAAQPEPIRINLNEPIKVKLTDWGKEIYYHQYDRTNQIAGREICKPRFPREDENGYTEFQLWCFIELYGMHMGMTLPNVIEPLEIVYER